MKIVLLVDRDAHVVPIAHQQQLRDVPHRERKPDDAVAAIVRAVGSDAMTSPAIVSQYDVVCICCSGRSSSPEPDVLVRVELDLLEADDARDDVDLAVRTLGSRLRRCLRSERVQNRHLRVRDGVRVVVAVDRAHEGLAAIEVEPLDLIELSLDDVDRLLVQRRGRAGEIGFADDAASPRVMSTTTKLSDETDRRLTASAGYDSCVQFHWPSAWWTKPSSARTWRISCTFS